MLNVRCKNYVCLYDGMLSWYVVVYDLRRLNDELVLCEFDGMERFKMVFYLLFVIIGYIIVFVIM